MIKPQIINKLKSINELQLLIYLSRVGEWTHNKHTRPVIADVLDMAEITLKKGLRSLIDKGFIRKTSKGLYTINKDIIDGTTTR